MTLFEDQTFRGVQMSRVKAGGSFVAAELAAPSGLLLVLAGTECVIWPPVKNPSTEHSKSRWKETHQHARFPARAVISLNENKWMILHILQQAWCRTCVQRTCNAAPLTRAPSVSLPLRMEPVRPFKMPMFRGKRTEPMDGWVRLGGKQRLREGCWPSGLYLGKRSDWSSRWRPCTAGRRKEKQLTNSAVKGQEVWTFRSARRQAFV